MRGESVAGWRSSLPFSISFLSVLGGWRLPASRSPKAGHASLPECGAAFWEGSPPRGNPESRSTARLPGASSARALRERDAGRATQKDDEKGAENGDPNPRPAAKSPACVEGPVNWPANRRRRRADAAENDRRDATASRQN